METIGVVLAIWVLSTTMPRNFNMLPMVQEGGTLIVIGLYKIVGHHVHSAIFVIILVFVLNHRSPFPWCVRTVLLINLVVESMFEEEFLLHCCAQKFC